ncbi:hypothetical protein FHG87_011084 [Trinorchestia longiramus]|nr:hypothetical protein FHG87_011084 [Trinorchestia longiramus]
MIYEAGVKNERQKVENIRNKGPDGIKEWYNFIQGINRSNEAQIHELVVDGCKVSDHFAIAVNKNFKTRDTFTSQSSVHQLRPPALEIGATV